MAENSLEEQFDKSQNECNYDIPMKEWVQSNMIALPSLSSPWYNTLIIYNINHSNFVNWLPNLFIYNIEESDIIIRFIISKIGSLIIFWLTEIL